MGKAHFVLNSESLLNSVMPTTECHILSTASNLGYTI